MNLIFDEITLRAIEEQDNEILKNLINDPDVESGVGGWSFPSSDEKQKQWYQAITANKDLTIVRFAVDIEGNCVGMAALHAIDYKNSNAGMDIKLIRDVRGKGIGYKVIKMLERYAFEELNLHVLISEILEDNVSSRKAFEKAGFILDGIMRSRIYKNGRYHGQCSYSLLKSEYQPIQDENGVRSD